MLGLLFAKSASTASVAILELTDAAFTGVSENTLNGVTILVPNMDVTVNTLTIFFTGFFILL
ncbi:hypothetical protein PGRAN_11073 [Listeria grandensis FSL F6-0971]|uniref:Uncharacterized protein n=1 Tax=Listeria grandensis FSL F6-0971 TaxID=1265819 RepID=W7BAC7_9LIST|nr:hypothetical protein PGRAN_11073 [Listeria grandensis FSL F6-0971]